MPSGPRTIRRTVYLARHGETEWNKQGRWQGHTDIALNETGRAQAAELAHRLRDHTVAHIFSSDLSRAHETGRIVSDHIGAPFAGTDPDFRERAFGAFEGLTREQCQTQFPEAWRLFQADPRNTPPGAEPRDVVIGRVETAVRRVAAFGAQDGSSGLSGSVLVVSHGGSIRMWLSTVLGRALPPLGNGGIYRVVVAGSGFEDIEILD